MCCVAGASATIVLDSAEKSASNSSINSATLKVIQCSKHRLTNPSFGKLSLL